MATLLSQQSSYPIPILFYSFMQTLFFLPLLFLVHVRYEGCEREKERGKLGELGISYAFGIKSSVAMYLTLELKLRILSRVEYEAVVQVFAF